ncbi:MAG: hypothetical protein LBG60_13995, partial [Bifidobacteriaceae bacterium]|nr:hypothetical protein [Bifidobacteriaceae bacterium]
MSGATAAGGRTASAVTGGGRAAAVAGGTTAEALEGARRHGQRFLVKGVSIALISGALYGLYSAFLVQGQAVGPFAVWLADTSPLSAFVRLCVLAMVACALNDALSAVWAVAWLAVRGKLPDLGRSIRSKPGLVMVACAVIGGPVANGSYVMALQM